MNKPRTSASRGDAAASMQDILLATPWVRDLCEAARVRVLLDAQERTFEADTFVARRGEIVNAWMCVAEGLLKVCTVTASGRAVTFSALAASSWIGEGAVIKHEPRRYDLVALRRTRMILVPRPTFMWLLETSIPFNRAIIDQLSERTSQYVAVMETGRLTDPAARLATGLINLFNPVVHPNADLHLQFSQEELGELAGLSRPTTNIAIKELAGLGLVRATYGGLEILDVDGLRRFVCDRS